MAQRTVLKVDTSCLKCRKKLFMAVTSLEGLDKIEADAAKGTLSVTGNADPYEIIVRSRKTGKHVQVVSIGPPPAPPKPDAQKKQEEKKPDQKPQQVQLSHSCAVCERVAIISLEPYQSCCLM